MRKYFLLRFWFNGKAHKLTIGQFIPGKFGVKQCEDKIYEIVRGHQNDRGMWIKDPAQTLIEKETRIAQKVIIESEKLTVNQVIERYVNAGFPRKKGQTKRGTSIKRDCLYLLGHNWRRHHLAFEQSLKSLKEKKRMAEIPEVQGGYDKYESDGEDY